MNSPKLKSPYLFLDLFSVAMVVGVTASLLMMAIVVAVMEAFS